MKRITAIALTILAVLLLASCDDTLEYCTARFTVEGKNYYINGDTYASTGLQVPAGTPYTASQMYCVYTNSRCTRIKNNFFLAVDAKREEAEPIANIMVRFYFYKNGTIIKSSNDLVSAMPIVCSFNNTTDILSFINLGNDDIWSLGSSLFDFSWTNGLSMNAREVTE